MLCPVCKSAVLEDKELDLGLKGYSCGQCLGNWVRFNDYIEWKNAGDTSNQITTQDSDYNLEYDNKKANFCPDCGRILIKYKVSGVIPFYVDHCGSCNGLWLDRSEWEVIVGNNLQYQVNDFFTTEWQEKIRQEMTAQRFEENYRRKFGDDNYDKLKEIRKWIYECKQKGEMISFLIDEDPYKI